jgi:hypothetical protein
MIRATTIRVTTTGQDASATGTGYSASPINGELLALAINWHASAPDTSDIAVTVEADDDLPAVSLYAKDNANTDATAYPHVQATDVAGSAISGVYDRIPVTGRIKVAVSGCNALTNAVVVTAYVRD